MKDIEDGTIKEGKLIAGRWRVITELETKNITSYRVRNTEDWDGELLILNELSDLPEKVSKLKDMPVHDNIIHSVEAGSWAGVHYLVRQQVTGQKVKDWLWREDTLEYDQALGIACQMCLASNELIKSSVYYLGYGSDSVMVDPQGFVKIDPLLLFPEADDGYLAPEQLSGEEPDQQTDIYRMGLLIYEMLNGKLPEKSEQGKVKLESLHELNTDIPPELDFLLDKMTALHKSDRPIDTEEVLNILHPLLMKKPLPEHSVVEGENAPKAKWYEGKKFWLYIGFGLLAVALLMALITGTLNFFAPQ